MQNHAPTRGREYVTSGIVGRYEAMLRKQTGEGRAGQS